MALLLGADCVRIDQRDVTVAPVQNIPGQRFTCDLQKIHHTRHVRQKHILRYVLRLFALRQVFRRIGSQKALNGELQKIIIGSLNALVRVNVDSPDLINCVAPPAGNAGETDADMAFPKPLNEPDKTPVKHQNITAVKPSARGIFKRGASVRIRECAVLMMRKDVRHVFEDQDRMVFIRMVRIAALYGIGNDRRRSSVFTGTLRS